MTSRENGQPHNEDDDFDGADPEPTISADDEEEMFRLMCEREVQRARDKSDLPDDSESDSFVLFTLAEEAASFSELLAASTASTNEFLVNVIKQTNLLVAFMSVVLLCGGVGLFSFLGSSEYRLPFGLIILFGSMGIVQSAHAFVYFVILRSMNWRLQEIGCGLANLISKLEKKK
jgi:hypothetical protein